ncbi:MAG: glycosyltransferase [Spartobacteria bacterium]|nr:glycosyltransferase [Spartobacteria bacterium]
MNAIHQLTAGYSRGDAISTQAINIRKIIQKWGHPSEIFSETARVLPELRREIGDVSTLPSLCQPDDIAILHLSIGSVVNRIFSELKCKKVIIYHNITPPELVKGIVPQMAAHAEKGLVQVRAMHDVAQVVLADSQFNADELTAMGYSDVKVLPLILDFKSMVDKPDKKVMNSLSDGKTNILFVGRCAPNKRIEDILAAFYYYQRYVNPDSRLIHAGSFNGMEAYHAYLLTICHENGLKDVQMPGSVTQSVLNAYYQKADLFLCLSDHEGFCIPLLEAMENQIPVMAYDAGAVAETMQGAGVLVKEKHFDLIAEMMGQLTTDKPLRQAVLSTQNRRLDRYKALHLEDDLRRHLDPLR